jgi:hypothetical protein
MVHNDKVTVPPIIKPPAKDAVFPLMVHNEMTTTVTVLEWTATPPP